MPRIKYVSKNFGLKALRTIENANQIIKEYQAQGFDLTLRQLYYQFVSRDLLPNTLRDYKNLGNVISDARLAGLIDWNAIVDRTRNLQSLSHWEKPADIIEACAKQFRVDLWEDQEYRVEVWIEKDALLGVIEDVCRAEDVPYFSCRGYTSQSELWSASQRIIGYTNEGQMPIIIHLGDHDPSGKDMTRDIEDRMRMFGADVHVERIALNMDQIRKFKPPPNPAKFTDSRAKAYVAEFGRSSWELDALDPRTLATLIKETIAQYRNDALYEAAKERQQAGRDQIQTIADELESED